MLTPLTPEYRYGDVETPEVLAHRIVEEEVAASRKKLEQEWSEVDWGADAAESLPERPVIAMEPILKGDSCSLPRTPNERQQHYVQLVLSGYPLRDAAKQAGYSSRSAYRLGSVERMKQNPVVVSLIASAIRKISDKENPTNEEMEALEQWSDFL